MTYSTDTDKALATISTKLGQSIKRLRQRHAGLNDADLIEALRDEFSLGHISWPGAPCELRDSDREWLRWHQFAAKGGSIVRGSSAACLPLEGVVGVAYDLADFLPGDQLSEADQRWALENFGVNRIATEPDTIVYRRGRGSVACTIEHHGKPVSVEVIVIATESRIAVAGPAADHPGPFEIRDKFVVVDTGGSDIAHTRYVEFHGQTVEPHSPTSAKADHVNYYMQPAEWKRIAGIADFGNLYEHRATQVARYLPR